jgi:hypothetical protein
MQKKILNSKQTRYNWVVEQQRIGVFMSWSVPGPGKWKFHFSKTSESDAMWILQCHDSATATTSAPLRLIFETAEEGPNWLFRAFRVAPEPVDSYLRGEVDSSIAGPIVHEIYALGQPDGESSPWFYGQYLEAHPLPVNAKLLIDL